MYQMGGKLPTLTTDFLDVRPVTDFRPAPIGLQPTSFDPSNAIRMEQLDMQRENQALNEARIKVEEARAKKFEADAKQKQEKEEKDNFDASVKYINNMVKDMEKRTNPITGLFSDIPGANQISLELTGKVNKLREAAAKLTLAQATGNKPTPDMFKEVTKLREDINLTFEDPKYKKLLLGQAKILDINKKIQKNASSSQGILVNREALGKTMENIGKFITNPDADDLDIADIEPPDLFFNVKDIDKLIDEGVESFADRNTNKINSFINVNERAMKVDKTLVTDLSKPETFVNAMLRYVNNLPQGKAYLDYIGGEDALKSHIGNKAAILQNGWGERVVQSLGQDYKTIPGTSAPRAGSSGTGGEDLDATLKKAVKMRQALNDLGFRVTADNGGNDYLNPGLEMLGNLEADKEVIINLNKIKNREIQKGIAQEYLKNLGITPIGGTQPAATSGASAKTEGVTKKKKKEIPNLRN